MKKLYFLIIALLITSLSFGQIINEFEPNPSGTDPSNVSFELKGNSGESFSGWILSIESDGPNGIVDRATNVSGTFDSNGLLVVSVPDLENPSFTVILSSDFTGSVGTTDIDTNNDGVADDTSSLGTIYDAIGIPDATNDEASLYGSDLGGEDFVYTGSEPALVFRDGTNNDWYAVNAIDDTSVYDILANPIPVASFDTNPATSTTFGVINPSRTSTGPILIISSPTEGTSYSPLTSSVDVSLSVQNFDVANGTGDGHIVYTVNSGAETDKYDTSDISVPVSTGNSYTVYVELVDNSGNPLSTPVNATVNFSVASIIQVSNLTALRSGTEGEYYEFTGEAVISYARSIRNQKYIEDASIAVAKSTKSASGSGILIDDNSGIITSTYNQYDGISGLKGQLIDYNGILEFVPIADPGVASSTGNTITPEEVTASEIATNWENYESELVVLKGMTFTDGDGINIFSQSTNYDISDGTTTLTFRTLFSEADYIGQLIPTGSQDIVVLVGEYNGTPQVVARDLADMTATLGVNRNSIIGFSVFPNPATNGKIWINTQNNSQKQVKIFDILGKQVLSSSLSGRELNVSKLTTGIYILRVQEEGKTATRKLVIK